MPGPPLLSPQTSSELAKVEGPYSTYEGSPMSKGVMQFDMWGVTPSSECHAALCAVLCALVWVEGGSGGSARLA